MIALGKLLVLTGVNVDIPHRDGKAARELAEEARLDMGVAPL